MTGPKDPDETESDPTLEDALDGLQAAQRYCESIGFDAGVEGSAELYQAVAKRAPAEDWDDSGDPE